MDDTKKKGRYHRIYAQLELLLQKTDDPIARMATICALLHHKMNHYFWTGFYLLKGDKLIVGPYQGPVACQELEKETGVCWASIHASASIVVPDVHAFPGHIDCDARSKSEITIPVFDRTGKIRAIFDVDSDKYDSFSDVDKTNLERIISLAFSSISFDH